MKRYLLDTSVYGVLVDENEEDYDVVREIIDYAKRNREQFVTTFIIAKELDAEDVSKYIKNITLPAYYSSISVNAGILEVLCSDKFELAEKLAWNYIQRLEKKEADKVMYDAMNYAWGSIAGIDVFVTRNRRGILAKNYRQVLRTSNNQMRLRFVKIMSPTEFYEMPA